MELKKRVVKFTPKTNDEYVRLLEMMAKRDMKESQAGEFMKLHFSQFLDSVDLLNSLNTKQKEIEKKNAEIDANREKVIGIMQTIVNMMAKRDLDIGDSINGISASMIDIVQLLETHFLPMKDIELSNSTKKGGQ